MVRQLALSFPNIPSYAPAAYVVGEGNREAYDWLKAYPTWRSLSDMNGVLITGDKFSGKTHLCHVLRDMYPEARMLNGAIFSSYHPFEFEDQLLILDDADRAPASWLFHLYNHFKAKGNCFVMTMKSPYQDWCTLNDLSSRFATLPHFNLSPPDDHIMISVFQKKLGDLGIVVERSVLSYLAQHIERSYTSIDAWINQLNRLSAEQKKNITLPFIRSVLMSQ
jgi:chromosomal replication initiation ATPase DnaA